MPISRKMTIFASDIRTINNNNHLSPRHHGQVAIIMTEEASKRTGWGGRRTGSGRKPIDGEEKVKVNLLLSRTAARLLALAGNKSRAADEAIKEAWGPIYPESTAPEGNEEKGCEA